MDGRRVRPIFLAASPTGFSLGGVHPSVNEDHVRERRVWPLAVEQGAPEAKSSASNGIESDRCCRPYRVSRS